MNRRLLWIVPLLIAAAVLYWFLARGPVCDGPVLTCCGAAREVGGSCHLIEWNGTRFIVDCGDRGRAGVGVIPPSPETLSFVLLTHAHTDHCGLLPELYGLGFGGRVYCAGPTAELVPIMLRMKRSMARRGSAKIDFEKAVEHITSVPFGEVARDSGISFRFVRAGHLLGAACIEVWTPAGDDSVKIVFSGDLGSCNLLLVPPPDRIAEADYVVMESTYGGTVRDGGETEAGERHRAFAADLARALGAGGDVLIPSFALGRTQEILAVIDRSIREGIIPPGTEVFTDSPTAKKITDVYRRSRDELSAWARAFYGDEILHFPGLREVPGRTSLKVHARRHRPSIFVSTSGDLTFANSPRHLMRIFDDAKNLLCVVGWQAPGSTGRRLAEGECPVRVRHREGKEIRRDWISPLCAIKRYGCFSGHADQDALLEWLRAMRGVQRVFLVHGELDQMRACAERIARDLGLEAVLPRAGERIALCVAPREGIRTASVSPRSEHGWAGGRP